MSKPPSQRVTPGQQTALASLSQVPHVIVPGQTYSNLKSTMFNWADYVSMREQGFIVEGPPTTGAADPNIGITRQGVAAQNF